MPIFLQTLFDRLGTFIQATCFLERQAIRGVSGVSREVGGRLQLLLAVAFVELLACVSVVYLGTYYLGWGASSSNSTRNLGPIFGTSCVSLGLVGELGGLQGISLRWSSIWDLIWRLLRNSSPLGSIWDLSILGRSQVPGFSRQRPLKSSCHTGYYNVLFICEERKILSGLVVVVSS